jgi:UDP-3-O-[3-hydroxymyristoyl] glucosamine N-acyltransferase
VATVWPTIAGDQRFFLRTGPHPLAAVATAAGGEAPDSTLMLAGVAPLQSAGPSHVSFLDNRRYLASLEQTQAGAVIISAEFAAKVPAGTLAIVTEEPYLGWARAAALFHPPPPPRAGVHPAAVVEADAVVDPTAEIGPLAVIGERAEIGARCRVGAGAVVGPGVVMGPDCRIGPNASVSHALLGARVYVYAGARIGQEGFGFASSPTGFVTVPQLGRVILEDDVEVGANSTIDRGSSQDTVIGAGSRLDNLVQIGHNVRLGRCCVIVSQVGISGSTVLEDFVVVAGQAGFLGHLHVGAKARIGAQSGVISDVAAGAEVVGSPAYPAREHFRQLIALRRLGERKAASARSGEQQAGAGESGAKPETTGSG